MPGIPTKFAIADIVFDRIRLKGGPEAELLGKSDTLRFAFYGVIGAAIGDFIAARPEIGGTSPNSPYFQTWLPVLRMFAGSPAVGSTPATRGLYKDIKQLVDTLTKLQGIVNDARNGGPIDKDIAKVKLIGMKDELEDLQNAASDMQTVVAGLNSPVTPGGPTIRQMIGASIFKGGPKTKVKPSTGWDVRDTLHNSHTGKFLRAVRDTATTGDDNAKAYAVGASVGYSADLCGNPFINSIVGSPYRTHWWRHRWISNYVDSWIWGYYRLGGAASVSIPGVVPNPLYTNWPNVCEAKLHERINIGFDLDAIFAAIRGGTPVPNVVPQPFLDFWKNAYSTAYGTAGSAQGIDDAGLQSAFAMAYLILWLQTSGTAIPCVPPDQINYPDDCGARPPWVGVDGSVVTGGSTPSTPPAASKDTHPSVAEVVSGIVLAILGVLNILIGNVAGGVGLIAAGAAAVADGETDPDWDQLHCYVGWVFAFVYNLTNALHDMLKWSGLGFPYTQELAHNDIAFSISGTITPADSALNTVRSVGRSETYPASQWVVSPPASNWDQRPTEPLETPVELAYASNVAPTWPFHFADGFVAATQPPAPAPPVPPVQVNPLFSMPGSPPLVRDAAQFASRQAMLNVPTSTNSLFGNAVDVSLELIFNTQTDQLLDWDLDGDPGIGYPTWLLPDVVSSRSASIPEA